MDLKCSKCGTDKECLAGHSAHINNWYCPQCDNDAKPLVYISEDGEKLHYPQWWNAGGGISISRDALSYNHPEQTYNLIKRYGIRPEDYGIEHPLAVMKREEFTDKSRDELILEIINLREELDCCYKNGL